MLECRVRPKKTECKETKTTRRDRVHVRRRAKLKKTRRKKKDNTRAGCPNRDPRSGRRGPAQIAQYGNRSSTPSRTSHGVRVSATKASGAAASTAAEAATTQGGAVPGGRQASASGGGGEVNLEEQHEADPVGEADVDHEVPPGGGRAAAGQQPAVEHVLEHDDEVPRAHWTETPGRPGQRQTPEAQVEAKWQAAHAQDRAGAPVQGVKAHGRTKPECRRRHKLYGPTTGTKASSRPEVNRAPTQVRRPKPP